MKNKGLYRIPRKLKKQIRNGYISHGEKWFKNTFKLNYIACRGSAIGWITDASIIIK
jgi:hypothetical protein